MVAFPESQFMTYIERPPRPSHVMSMESWLIVGGYDFQEVDAHGASSNSKNANGKQNNESNALLPGKTELSNEKHWQGCGIDIRNNVQDHTE